MNVTIRGKRWYYRLVPTTEGRGKSLLEAYNSSTVASSLIVCFTPSSLPNNPRALTKEGNPIRLYSLFPSYLEFYDYSVKFSQSDRCFYEMIFGERPQKPHFDIDIGEDALKRHPEDTLDSLAENVKDDLIGVLLTLLDVQPSDILLYSSHGSNKRSYHLLVNGVYHSNNNQAKIFYEKTMRAMCGVYSDLIDHAVYSSRQQFRIVGSQKVRSGRPKIFHETFSWRGQEITHRYSETTENEELKKRIVLYESLVSFTSGCRAIPDDHVSHRRTYTLGTIEESQVEEVMSMVRSQFGSVFSLKDVTLNSIALKRNRPSFCSNCNKTHEHENPYVFIFDGKVYWDCRRSKGSRSLLGTVKSLPQTNDEVFSFGETPPPEIDAPTPTDAPLGTIVDVQVHCMNIANGWAKRKVREITYDPPEDLTWVPGL